MARFVLIAIAALGAAPLAAAPVNAFNQRLLALDKVNQLAILRQAIDDGQGKCAHAVAAAYRGAYKNLERWDVACDRGGNYGVFVGPDGTSQIRSCADIGALALPACQPISTAAPQSRKSPR